MSVCLQAVLDTLHNRLPGCRNDVCSDPDSVPGTNSVTGLNMNTSLRCHSTLTTENPNFEIDQVKLLNHRKMASQSLSQCEVERVGRANAQARGVNLLFTDSDPYYSLRIAG